MIIISFRAVTLRLRPNKHQQKVLEETRLVCMGPRNNKLEKLTILYPV